ncbi:MAG: hypothetical protein KKC68_03005 [Candidatus Thermoplasmatota archaeon]|nr:hypothetical protein [Candidatus Thermoplasmatota archaeon]MBU1940722.1 hypothetical protein [Candidatus Thermoplasmatota archaeon]
MMLIVRMFPRMDINKVWDYVEKDLVKSEATKYVTPLYATQTEGMMSVGVIFDVKDPDNIAHFLVDHLANYDEVHHTKTVSLMKPTFFPIPKKRPHNAQRYVIRIYTHARNYRQIYDYLVNYKYPFNLFPVYVTYSLGDEDIILNIGSDSFETVNTFVREKLRSLEGADTVTIHPVIKAKRFASLEELIKLQTQHLTEKGKKVPASDQDKDFDWVEDFEFYAMLTGAFRRDL